MKKQISHTKNKKVRFMIIRIISAILIILITLLFISCYFTCLHTLGLVESEDHIDIPWKRLLVTIFLMGLLVLLTSYSVVLFLITILYIISILIWIYLLIIYLFGGYFFGYFPFVFFAAVCVHSCLLLLFLI